MQVHFFFCMLMSSSQDHLLKRLSFRHYVACAPLSRSIDSIHVGCLWGICSVSLICLSIPLPTPHCLDYCNFIVNLEVMQCQFSYFVLLLQYCIGYSEFLASPYKLQTQLVSIHQITCCDFDWDCTEAIDQDRKK